MAPGSARHMAVGRWGMAHGELGNTFFVPLCRVQMDSSMSTRSPKEYGKGGPEAMAEATADLRKSMAWRDGYSGV